MCVAVSIMPGEYLTELEVEKMHICNSDGAGVAWVDNGTVRWFKTTKVDLEHIYKVIHYHKDRPRLVHFRLSTAGGVTPFLCHPFEIGPLANNRPIGEAAKVMIHNGHWGRWDELYELLKKEGALPDQGPWSDTRLIAYLASDNPDWLEVLGGRVATLDAAGQFTHLGDWQELRQGIKVSNKHWDTATPRYRRGGYQGYNKWHGWGWTEEELAAYEQEKKEKRDSAGKVAEAVKSLGAGTGQGEAAEATGVGAGNGGVANSPGGDGDSGSGSGGQGKEMGQKGGEVTNEAGGPGSGGNRWQELSEAYKGGDGHGSQGPVQGVGSGLRSGTNPRGRIFDQEPWTHPYNGRVYKVDPTGKVVEVVATNSPGGEEAEG